MSNSLSPDEADNVVKSVLPVMSNWIYKSMFGRGYLRVDDIAKVNSAVKREGSNPDTYCKIAGAALKYGVGIDLRKDRNSNMVLSFRMARLNESKPSPEICEARWKMIKNLDFEHVKRLNFVQNDIDNLSQKDAEKIIKLKY